MNRNQTLKELGEESRELGAERKPILTAISQIGLSLRALNVFINNRFPQPLRKQINPMKDAVEDLTRDPLQAFADSWVNGMDGKGSPKAIALRAAKERDRKARARPPRDWDAHKKAHVKRVWERE